MLLPKIKPYYDYLDDITNDEIDCIIKSLNTKEKYRYKSYLNSFHNKSDITIKRIFIFLCILIDTSEREINKEP